MAKRVTHTSELEGLFRSARRDVLSVLEQERLRDSVLTALRSGQQPAVELLEPRLADPSTLVRLGAKLLTSLGVVAIVGLGIVAWQHSRAKAPAAVTAPEPPRESQALPRESTDTVAATSPPAPTSATLAAPESESATPLASRNGRALPSKSVPSESALIDQAHRELSRNPKRALQLTESHRKLYPKGLLVEEREVIAIEALTRLGKTQAAERRGSVFRNEQPHSIHELKLRDVLGDAGTGKQP